MILHRLSYLFLRLLTLPLALLSYPLIHRLGVKAGTLLFYLYPKWRKRAQSNLALAQDLKLSLQKIPRLAKESIQNLLITCLEYPKLFWEKELSRLVHPTNPCHPKAVMEEGKGAIFFCGHQANWELLFLDSTSRYPGVAIGRPVKNPFLYQWITAIREKQGGKMLLPKEALKEGLRALKAGKFVGIVGDQGMPDSNFSSPFFGRRAWTSPLPALLSYRTGRPIFVCTLKREKGKYSTRYSDPIWPNQSDPYEKEVTRLMGALLHLLEESIRETPSQWLWIHNRWKQQLPGRLKRQFRHDSLALILPEKENSFLHALSLLSTFRALYPLEFFTLFVPERFKEHPLPLSDAELFFYRTPDEILLPNFLPTLVFHFSDNPRIKPHFLSLSAMGVYSFEELKKLSSLNQNAADSHILKHVLLNGDYINTLNHLPQE